MAEWPDNCVDAIVTDPPYARKWLPLYEGIGEAAGRILKPGGSLLAILPHAMIPEITEAYRPFLRWRWLICMWQWRGGGNARLPGYAIGVCWKPIGWWSKGKLPKQRFKMDGFAPALAPGKKRHAWEQPEAWAEHCLRFAEPGGLVVDPCCGVGTLPIAARRAGFHFIGIEKEAEYCELARTRLAADAPLLAAETA